jgi:hypothetical protein
MIYRDGLFADALRMSGQKDVQAYPPVPMVYEHVPAEPLTWEYRVLSIDLREYDAPTADELNKLGSQGWLLVGMLNTERQGAHYYFVRQKKS